LKLYGKGGRTFRCLWMLEEAGLLYERSLVDWSIGESRTPGFLRINPNGKVPVLEDGELVLFESLAINYHIARTYAEHLWPATQPNISRSIQWLAWAMGELEGPHDTANRTNSPVDGDRLGVSLNVLRTTLSRHEYMLGEEFTVVDLNTACLLLRPQYKPVIRNDPALRDWFAMCTERQALKLALN